MPTFEDIEITTSVSIDFEVFCGTCGAGLCNQSDTRHSRSRSYAQVTVVACDNCLESAKQEGRQDGILETKQELEEELEELKEQIQDLQNRLISIGEEI